MFDRVGKKLNACRPFLLARPGRRSAHPVSPRKVTPMTTSQQTTSFGIHRLDSFRKYSRQVCTWRLYLRLSLPCAMSAQQAATDSFYCVDDPRGVLSPARQGDPATARKRDRSPPIAWDTY